MIKWLNGNYLLGFQFLGGAFLKQENMLKKPLSASCFFFTGDYYQLRGSSWIYQIFLPFIHDLGPISGHIPSYSNPPMMFSSSSTKSMQSRRLQPQTTKDEQVAITVLSTSSQKSKSILVPLTLMDLNLRQMKLYLPSNFCFPLLSLNYCSLQMTLSRKNLAFRFCTTSSPSSLSFISSIFILSMIIELSLYDNIFQLQSSHMHSNENIPLSKIAQNQENIKKNLSERLRLIHQLRNNGSKLENYLSVEDGNKISNHCSQYTKIHNLVHQILRQRKGNQEKQITGHEQFWKDNMKMERQLEDELRQLKQIDIRIDNIINEEFDKCNEVDEIQENIRLILGKKEHDHIQKAQPYFAMKEKCLHFLKQKKLDKQAIKQHKLNLIKQILSLLQTLKQHRQAGLMYCLSRPEDQHQVKLLNRAIADINQMINNQKQVDALSKQETQLMNYMNDIQEKMETMTQEVFKLMSDQTTLYHEIEQIRKLKSENEYFQTMFLNVLGLGSETSLPQLCEKLSKYQHQLGDKEKQAIKIQQGIQTTNNTIKIFQHIFDKVESENSRRRNLMMNIETIKNKYNKQERVKEEINQLQSEIERMQLKKQKLSKTMETKIKEADVKTYKNIYAQIQQMERQTINKHKHIETMKNNINENTKNIYSEIIQLQHEYGDILSQTVPNLQMKSQSQSIKDVNFYLNKIFNRLSITD